MPRTPLFAVVVMAVAGEEKLQAHRIAGVVAGLIGVAILHGDGLGFESGQGLGILLCLAAAFSYGLSALVARRTLANSPPLGTATFQMLASAVMMTVVAGLIERPWQLPTPGPTTWLAVIGLSALSTRARLYRVLSDPAALRRHQRHAGDAADPGNGDPARISGAGREDFPAGDCRRAGDRQRAAVDRRAGVESLSRLGSIVANPVAVAMNASRSKADVDRNEGP